MSNLSTVTTEKNKNNTETKNVENLTPYIIDFNSLLKIVETNPDLPQVYDIWKHIYTFCTKPKFKIKELCIRQYRKPKIISKKNDIFSNAQKSFFRNSKMKEQCINIESIIWDCKKKDYFYYYTYYPASDGGAYEKDIRKLTEKEKNMSVWMLPSAMSSRPHFQAKYTDKYLKNLI